MKNQIQTALVMAKLTARSELLATIINVSNKATIRFKCIPIGEYKICVRANFSAKNAPIEVDILDSSNDLKFQREYGSIEEFILSPLLEDLIK